MSSKLTWRDWLGTIEKENAQERAKKRKFSKN